MRIVSGVFFVLMLLFCAVQYNDPDTLIWVLVYGTAAIWCGIAAFRPALLGTPVGRPLLWATLGLAVAGVVWYWPHTAHFWEVDVWWATETAREGMGMMIAFLAVGSVWLTARANRH
jgi:hypothetical protein